MRICNDRDLWGISCLQGLGLRGREPADIARRVAVHGDRAGIRRTDVRSLWMPLASSICAKIQFEVAQMRSGCPSGVEPSVWDRLAFERRGCDVDLPVVEMCLVVPRQAVSPPGVRADLKPPLGARWRPFNKRIRKAACFAKGSSSVLMADKPTVWLRQSRSNPGPGRPVVR